MLYLMCFDENQLSFLLKEHKMKSMSGKGSSKISCQNRNYVDCFCSISTDPFRNRLFLVITISYSILCNKHLILEQCFFPPNPH